MGGSPRLLIMIDKIKFWFIGHYDNFMYKYGPERLELARLRLAAHEKAMKEGYQSPYTDPDDYDSAWRPLVKRRRKAT